jgi:hypothetical protein
MYPFNSIHSTHRRCILFILLWPLMGPCFFYQIIIGRNITDRKKPKYWGENRSQCHFVHPKSHRDWTWASIVGSQGLGYDINMLLCNMIHFWSCINYKFVCFRLWIDIRSWYLDGPCTEDSFTNIVYNIILRSCQINYKALSIIMTSVGVNWN